MRTQRHIPRWSDFEPLLRTRPLDLDGTHRRLSRAYDVGDLRAIARRRTPRSIFDYVDGAAEREISIRRARQVLGGIEFHPSVLHDVSEVDTATTLFGHEVGLPYVFSPTGFTRMMHHEGELAVARSAQRFGVPYTLSTMGTESPEAVAEAAPEGHNWFGFYVWKDRAASEEILQRVSAAGYEVLVITVDVPVAGARLRDNRNGFSIPPSLSLRTFADGAMHPNWWVNFLTTEPLRFATFSSWDSTIEELANHMFDNTVGIDDLRTVREMWKGPLVVKGIQTLDDARRVADAGADGVVLSNHGGRQLDRAVVPIQLLPRVVEALPGLSVFVDTGFSSGADIVAALALGARSVFLGRAYLYGLMAGGERGVDRLNEILSSEIARTLRLLGVHSVRDLTPEMVSLP
jgi:L-lactate dehydrogenase (cytochrome)